VSEREWAALSEALYRWRVFAHFRYHILGEEYGDMIDRHNAFLLGMWK
jgi:hypothetical protein